VFGAPSAAWSDVVRLFAAGLLDLGPLVTHEFALTEFDGAVDLLHGTRDDVGKVLIRP
jgi:L-iditol 2-dehydrogenase